MSAEPAGKARTFRDSAAVVMVRGEGEALEVFWALRSDAVSFMPGFHGFIGGSVDAGDAELPLAGAADDADRALRGCAIREAFEETGVLVALDPACAPPDAATLGRARQRLLENHADFGTLAREHRWRFRADALTFAGRWQTPPFAAMRFDTVFFLVTAPPEQEAQVRPGELASGEWIRPREALERWRRGEATFAAPILHTLRALADGGGDLAARLARAPEAAGRPVRRIELKWGIVLHPMKTKPLPPATHTNAYLIGERELALVDPGSGDPEELEALFTLLGELEREGRRLATILVTHAHADHSGGVEAVAAHYDVPVAGHAEIAGDVRLDRTLADGDEIALAEGGAGAWTLRVLHTPGHARGHLCFLHERTRSLFCGDHLTGGRGTVVIDPPEGDMGDYLASLERLLTEPVETLFPGHGSPQGAAKARIRGLIEHRRLREAKVLAALGPAPRALGGLVEAVYADTPRELWGWAERSLLAHLLKLERDGRVIREGEGWQLAPEDGS